MFSEHTSQFVLKLSQLGSFLLVLFLASILLHGAVLLSLYREKLNENLLNITMQWSTCSIPLSEHLF